MRLRKAGDKKYVVVGASEIVTAFDAKVFKGRDLLEPPITTKRDSLAGDPLTAFAVDAAGLDDTAAARLDPAELANFLMPLLNPLSEWDVSA